MLIMSGIFNWNREERTTQRYGYFIVGKHPYEGSDTSGLVENQDNIAALKNKRVKLTAHVKATRQSSHIGDRFLGIFPEKPENGSIIELGVGTLVVRDNSAPDDDCSTVEIGIKPQDNRKRYWVDPHILYRLHDQTVEIHAEETNEEDSPVPQVTPVANEGVAISNGDGSFQLVGIDEKSKSKILPNVKRLGQGLFQIKNNFDEAGEEFKVK